MCNVCNANRNRKANDAKNRITVLCAGKTGSMYNTNIIQ